MITAYIRSSSGNTYQSCEHKYFLESVLGYTFQGHISGTKGTMVHKALEMLGRKKLAQQKGELFFHDDELDKTYAVEELTPDLAFSQALAFYLKKRNDFSDQDLQDCKKWFNKMITDYVDYTPINREVLDIEKFFDFEIEHDWAKYEYDVNGKLYTGRLAVKGTMDCIYKIDDETIEYSDYKTGRRVCWITDEKKDLDKLLDDFQFLLYHYALRKSYPEYKYFFFTPVYIKDGGPYTIAYTEDDIIKIENKLKDMFEHMKANKKPNLIKYGPKSFKCNFCSFKKEKFKNTNTSYCEFFEKEIYKLGIDKVTEKYIDIDKFFNYQDGGGKSAKTVSSL